MAHRKEAATFSFIGSEVTVTGDIVTGGRLHIDGRVTGDVRCALLSQGEGGAVTGNIVADEARLAGLVDGTVEAGTLALEATARISGDILYEALSIASGALVEGRFKRRRNGADGSESARAEAAIAPIDLPTKPQPPELFGSLHNLQEAQAAE